MSEVILDQVSVHLDEPIHLAIHELPDGGLEVIAVDQDGQWADAFPLPFSLQAAAAEVGIFFDTSTAARLDLEKYPGDFWDDQVTRKHGQFLEVTILGRSARKYLAIHRAVRTEVLDYVKNEAWTSSELARVAKWLRNEQLFDHRSGAMIMEVLNAGPDCV